MCIILTVRLAFVNKFLLKIKLYYWYLPKKYKIQDDLGREIYFLPPTASTEAKIIEP